jgi:dipeptidyl aminopeptidase/acylaminoacyl peptidase
MLTGESTEPVSVFGVVISSGEDSKTSWGNSGEIVVLPDENIDQEQEVDTPLPDYLQGNFQWTGFVFENVLEQQNAYTRYQISYLSEWLRISGIMNIPVGDGPFPLLILNHGYIDPAVYTNGRGLKREQDYLARQWFAVLHTDYRNHAFSDRDEDLLTTDAHLRTKKYWTDAIHAVLAVQEAIKWWDERLRGVDAERVWMLGHSMWGGVTMYALVAYPWLVDAAVLYAPVHSNEYYNFNRWLRQRLDGAWYNDLQERLWPLDQMETFTEISPETYFARVAAPIQIYFWTADDSCPVERGREIRDALVEQEKEVELIEYPWEKHEFTTEWTSFMRGMSTFFGENLRD